MQDQFGVVFVFSVLLVSTNGQCPSFVGNSAITSCEGPRKHGSEIYIDFKRISRPCTCTALPSFDGELGITSVSEEVAYECGTQIYVTNIQTTFIFGCPITGFPFSFLNVQFNQSVGVRAEYKLEYSSPSSGTFHHCLKFKQYQNQQNGISTGLNGNLSVICGSSTEVATTTASSTTSTTTLTSTRLSHASSPIEPSTETTTTSTSVVSPIKNTDATLSSSTINVSYDSLSMESKTDNPEMIYIIAGSAGGGAIILGLIILILVLVNRTWSKSNRKGPTEADMARTNEVFDSNPELPDNPLYLSSQPVDELGYNSDQEKQLGLPPTDSKTKKKINSDYDVPPNNKPIDHGATSMPVYAVPKRGKDRIPEVTSGDVYAEVCKPNRSTGKDPVRKRNEDGLLYMEVEQDTAVTKETNTNDKNEITEGVCYAEIKHT